MLITPNGSLIVDSGPSQELSHAFHLLPPHPNIVNSHSGDPNTQNVQHECFLSRPHHLSVGHLALLDIPAACVVRLRGLVNIVPSRESGDAR